MKWNALFGSLVLCACVSAPSYAGKAFLDRLLGLHGAGCDSTCCDTGCAAEPTCGVELAAPGCGLFSKFHGPTCGTEINACDPCTTGYARPRLFNHFAPSCGSTCAPTCGVEVAAPSCGCEPSYDPCYPRRRPLLELLGKIEANKRALLAKVFTRSHGCDCNTCGTVEPACGAELAPSCGPTCGVEIADPCCDSGYGRPSLLARLFHKRAAWGCDSYTGCSSCGGGVTTTAPSTPVEAPAASAAPAPPAPVVDPSAYLDTNRRVVQATSYVR